MKRFLLSLLLFCSIPLCACREMPSADIIGAVKPYVTQYECTKAILGTTDLLKDAHLRVCFLDDTTLEWRYTPNEGKERVIRTPYTYDKTTHELQTEMTVMGYTLKEKSILEDGAFSVTTTIVGKPFYLLFVAM